MREVPPLVLAIPTLHPAATDGVFYCQPTYLNAPHMRGDYEFILADTKKLVAQLRRDDPKMLEHAEHKFSGETAEQWLGVNSRRSAPEMGTWSWSSGRGLSMGSGQAGLIKLVQEIDLPCFPVTVEKATGTRAIQHLAAAIGYEGKSIYEFAEIQSHEPGSGNAHAARPAPR
jgi:hypothetical protein